MREKETARRELLHVLKFPNCVLPAFEVNVLGTLEGLAPPAFLMLCTISRPEIERLHTIKVTLSGATAVMADLVFQCLTGTAPSC